jgi:hypothetical protein
MAGLLIKAPGMPNINKPKITIKTVCGKKLMGAKNKTPIEIEISPNMSVSLYPKQLQIVPIPCKNKK